MKNKNFRPLLWALLCLIVTSCGPRPDAPVMLRCEYQENPLGIDTREPRFSWADDDSIRGAVQSAYQLIVSSNESLAGRSEGDMWNSHRIASSRSQFVTYEGMKLKPAHKYYWRVRSWNGKHRASAWSQVHWFETALLDASDWQAKWIAAAREKDAYPPRSVLVRKQFEVGKTVSGARLYITGLGNYQAFLNGRKVGYDLFTPGWTNYPSRIQYQVYDVTTQLKDGSNAIGVILGNMWWSGGIGYLNGNTYSRGPLRMLAQLAINYTDGSSEMVSTDGSWKFTDSPVVDNHLYNGETYDARLEIPGWAEADLSDSVWKMMTVTDTMKAILTVQAGPTMQASEELQPVQVSEPRHGVYVFDMGQNMVGWARLKVQGKPGTRIEMRFAELLHPDGTVAQENLRKAKATDVYILKGTGTETWEPKFTYHGFRYVQVSGLPAKPDNSVITGIVIHSAAPVTGHFACSNALLNKVFHNLSWGQKGNMMSVPTDCPQRDERLGWMGDAQIFATTASYNMNMDQFFAKWMRDITDCQDSSGYVYDVNPAIVVTGPAKPGWCDAIIMVPYDVYTMYGDKRIITDNYAGMKKWVDYMKKNSKDDIYEFGKDAWGGYGDWVAVVPSPTKPIGAAYYSYSSRILSRLASVLEDTAEASTLLIQANRAAAAYQRKYFIDSIKNYQGKTQTMNIIPYMFGITPASLKETVFGNLVKDVQERNGHLSTGFIGTKYILPMLSDNGQNELAYQVATQTSYPGWGYMVEKGATTMWELWNSDTERPVQMNSRNHFAYGSVGQWYYQYLAGIRPDFDEPGFKHSIIAPMPAGDLTWVEASLQTGYGLLTSRWDKTENSFRLGITIPANTYATIRIPVPNGDFTISESGKVVYTKTAGKRDSRHMHYTGKDDNSVSFTVNSGRYLFIVK